MEGFPERLLPELERRIHARTSRRVRNLVVEVSPERVVLRGLASSYYVKQLAQHGAQEVLPRLPLENDIAVDHAWLAAC